MKQFFFLILLLASGADARAEQAAVVPKAPLPQAAKLVFEPASLTLEDGRDERRVIVWGVSKDGGKFDLSSEAKFSEDSPAIEISADGYVHATAAGDATVRVSAGGAEGTLPVKVTDAVVKPVRFVRDVIPMMSRVGCNAGTCHGSAKGKNGFKLSLRGYDPDYDYQALINDISGRRFNRVAVDESLMLLKPTAEVPHEGRQVFKVGSREYNLLRDWIKEGAKSEDVAVGRANALEIFRRKSIWRCPACRNARRPGEISRRHDARRHARRRFEQQQRRCRAGEGWRRHQRPPRRSGDSDSLRRKLCGARSRRDGRSQRLPMGRFAGI
jgi:hypothetical protein